MTTASAPTARGLAYARGWREAERETRVFGAAVVAVALHVVVDAAARGGAVGLVEAAVALLAARLVLRGFASGGRPARALVAAALGLGALAAGLSVHVARVALAGPEATDPTGLVLTAAGAALVVLALVVALRGRRRRVQLLALPALLVVAQWVVVPAIGAGLIANAREVDVPTAASLGLPGARDVWFPAADGVRLAGWWVPGGEGAAVIVLHGSHSSRAGTVRHVRLLARAGYGVLAFDASGHGESGGPTNAVGWRGVTDLAGAWAFVRAQGLPAARIGALGLSMGAEEALRAAGTGVPLAAVVADGTGAATLGDQRLLDHGVAGPHALSSTWLAFRGAELLAGVDEPEPLQDAVRRIEAPVLLVASDAPDELEVARAYAARIGAGADLWHVAGAGHTAGLAERPHPYAGRVLDFLDAALGPARGRPTAP